MSCDKKYTITYHMTNVQSVPLSLNFEEKKREITWLQSSQGGTIPPICAAVSVWLPPFFPTTLQHQQGPQDNAPNQSNTPTIKARRPIGPYVLRSAPGAFSLRGIYCKVGQTVNPYTQANLIQPILVKTPYTEHYNFITSIHNDCVMVV